jgi:2-polyprenyl-3-methyl-5-hydroxy-6-metoxy-1,4-benzoquinol methylase
MFNENDIRPDKFRNSQLQSIDADIEFLKKRSSDFVHINCPTCSTAEAAIKFTKHTFQYRECPKCSMLYMSPRPTEKILSEFYPQSKQYDFFNEYIFPASIEVRRNNIFVPRVNRVLDLCKKFEINKDKILEVGTGFGLFCEEMAKTKAFQEVVGVEASDSLAERCQHLGFKLYNGLLEDLNIKERFNVAVAFEVIEHIANPAKFISICHDLLLPGGLIMLSFPNYDGFAKIRFKQVKQMTGNFSCNDNLTGTIAVLRGMKRS